VPENQTEKFNKFQELVFPIHKYELKKFLPMSILMFCLTFVYNLARNLKDWFIQYSSHLWIGAKPEETTSLISALKFWYVLPCAIIIVMVLTTLINKFGPDKTFYIIISIYMTFYFLYGYLIYPNLDNLILSPKQITEFTERFPLFFRTALVCLANWPLTLFYIFTDLWGTMAISSLFWQFANRVTMAHEVKRFFAMFPLLSNTSTVFAGGVIINYARSLDVNRVKTLMMLIIVAFILSVLAYGYVNKVALKDPRLYKPNKIPQKKKKEDISPVEGIKILFKSPYLSLIALVVFCYGTAINFSEILMKASMCEIFDSATYAKMQGILAILTGIVSILTVFINSYVLRKFKWKVGALVTPILFLTIGGFFLLSLLYKQFISVTIFGVSATIATTWLGIVNNAMAKGIKYSMFDTTKSMAYLPLPEDERNKGQAAVEIIGARAGKAGAAVTQQIMVSFPRTLMTVSGSVAGVLAYSFPIVAMFFTTVVIWIVSVLKLGASYEEKISDKNLE